MNDLDRILEAVQETAGYVERNLASQARGRAGTNPTGDDQIQADVWADGLFLDKLGSLDSVGGYASEERTDVIDCGEGYTVAIDPLDGSSNLASNNSVGTIIGVYDAPLPASGRHLVAATMVLYGPYTTMAVAREDRDATHEYLIRDGYAEPWGEYAVSDEETVVGLAGRTSDRSEAINAFAADLEGDLKLRYGGATVSDLAQVFEYGGLFGYPATDGYPDGKLRVHFESAPLAYIVEAAGGASTDGYQSLLDVDPDEIHGTTPTFLGTASLVDRLEAHLE